MTTTVSEFRKEQQITSVRLASNANVSGTYSNGQQGVGATLTVAASSLTIDSVACAVNDRVLLFAQTSGYQNGIYTVQSIGSTVVLERAPDFHNIEQIKAGYYVPISAGTEFKGSIFIVIEPLPGAIGVDTIHIGNSAASPDAITLLSNGLKIYDPTEDDIMTVSPAELGQDTVITIPDPGASTGSLVLASQSLDHTLINTTGAGKTLRLNSRTESTDTANSLIGFQSKIGRGVSAATDVIGAEISPRLDDAIALTGSGSIIGLHVDCYLKGTTGNIAGDVRGQQIELVDDTGSSRTVAGNMTHLRIRSNVSCAVTGKYSVLRVENEEGTKAMDGLVQFTTGSGCLVESSGTVGGTQDQAIKILIGTTTYYVPLYTAVS